MECTASLHPATTPSEPRPRFNSCHTEPSSLRHSPAPPWLPVEAEAFPTRDVTPPTETQPAPEVPATVPVDSRKSKHINCHDPDGKEVCFKKIADLLFFLT